MTKNLTTISISKPTKKNLELLREQAEESFENWSLFVDSLIQFVLKKAKITLKESF